MEFIPVICFFLLLIVLVMVIALFLRKPSPPSQEIPAALKARLDALENTLRGIEKTLREELAVTRTENAATTTNLRTELGNTLRNQTDSLLKRLDALSQTQREQLDAMTRANYERLSEIRVTLEKALTALREENTRKLDEMRTTVDEKLQGTLEKRLGESFKQVSERLENVYKSLGEIQAVASNVGDLKRVLTNVKTRGTWGEIQLGAILENMLLPDQYAANVKPNPRSATIVEFAVKLPGRENNEAPVWLPIDAKFPKEDYERLVDAAERADADAVEQAAKDLTKAVEKAARDIRDKYISPPYTTDFAILFLPTEGLHAEILRRAGVADRIQRECRVVIAGPTTLAALLNSLQMGFRTLAIQKRSGEVWKLLGAVKTQFGQFGELLTKVHDKLDDAAKVVGKAADRHRLITKKIEKVEALPEGEAEALIPLDDE